MVRTSFVADALFVDGHVPTTDPLFAVSYLQAMVRTISFIELLFIEYWLDLLLSRLEVHQENALQCRYRISRG